MFALVVHEEGRSPWRKPFAVRECRIGSAESNDLVIDARLRVSSIHARLVLKDGRYILVDLRSDSGSWVNGRRIVAPIVVKETDTILVGDVRIEIVTLAYEELAARPLRARDGIEAALLAAIDGHDDASRLVYADWLEGQGDHAHAELLRLQHALEGASDPAALRAGVGRMRELTAAIDLPWRARLSKLPIENCPRFAFQCPKRWSELTPTAVEGERHCGACQRTVHYCATIDEARKRAGEGACVAIDLASPRWQGDLDPPFGERVCEACDVDLGEALRDCPRCGARIEDELVMLGELA